MNLEEYLDKSLLEVNKETSNLKKQARDKGLPFADTEHFRREAFKKYILTEIFTLKEQKNGKRSSKTTRNSTSKSK